MEADRGNQKRGEGGGECNQKNIKYIYEIVRKRS